MVGCGWELAVRTASPGQGGLQMTRWPLVSTGAPTSQLDPGTCRLWPVGGRITLS